VLRRVELLSSRSTVCPQMLAFSGFFSLAGAAIADRPVPLQPPWGMVQRLAITKMSKYLLLRSY